MSQMVSFFFFQVFVSYWSFFLIASQKLTEQRVPVFSHEIVPDYLRTKPDPEVEEQEKQLSTEAARIGPDAAQVSWTLVLVGSVSCRVCTFKWINTFFCTCEQKQIQLLNKMCSNLLEKLNNPREDRDAESAGVLHFFLSLCSEKKQLLF